MELDFHVRGCRNDTNISLLIAVLFETFIFHSEIPASVHVTLNTTTHQPCAALSHYTQDVSFSYSTSRNSANRYRYFILRNGNFWCADLRRETGCFTLNYLFFFNTFNRHYKYYTDPSICRREIEERVGLYFYSTHTPSGHEKVIPRT